MPEIPSGRSASQADYDQHGQGGGERQPYRPPRLTVHGAEPPTPQIAERLRCRLEKAAAERRLNEGERRALDRLRRR